jgi:hypothetical protein
MTYHDLRHTAPCALYDEDTRILVVPTSFLHETCEVNSPSHARVKLFQAKWGTQNEEILAE